MSDNSELMTTTGLSDHRDYVADFLLDPETTYLNHGSFSPALHCVRDLRRQWIDRLDCQPMDFYLRQFEPALATARKCLADFVGTDASNLALIDNATYGMNIVADSVRLNPGDQVLLNDHEYGAVVRIWQRACDRQGATLVTAKLPARIEDDEAVVNALVAATTDRTRLVVCSHITSATAIVLPVEKICQQFRSRGIAVCIDGPHAPVQVDLNLDQLNCDYYTASCHKWLCGSLGTGFLYVAPDRQDSIEPPIKSWGRLLPAVPQRWDEEFGWIGTRDPSPFLSLPAAIEYMTETIGIDTFRQHSRSLAKFTENLLADAWKTTPLASRERGFYGSMVHVPLPPGDWTGLQQRLWEQHRIEVMVPEFNAQWYIRVSCHLYNSQQQIEELLAALQLEGVG